MVRLSSALPIIAGHVDTQLKASTWEADTSFKGTVMGTPLLFFGNPQDPYLEPVVFVVASLQKRMDWDWPTHCFEQLS